MNIALINQFFPPAQAPTGLLLHDLARALADRGHRVTVLASAGRYGAAGADGEYGLPGVRVQRLGSARPHRSGFVSKALDYALFYLRVNRALRRLDPAPDAVVCQTTPPFIGLAAARLRARRGVPYVLWCMDLYPEALASHGSLRSGSWPYRLLERLARRERSAASRVVVLGPDMAALAEPKAGNSVVEIPVWSRLKADADLNEAAAELRRARGWGTDETVLLYSGNMGRAHRAEEFARLAESLAGRVAPCRFVFCGSGPRKAEWQRRWGGLFEFLEPEPAESFAAQLLAADVHLVSQEPAWQGIVVPSKFQAACALGRPVVFAGPPDSAVGRWIRESDCGWVLPPGDALAVADAARGVADAAEVRQIAGRALALSGQRFDAANNVERMVRVVEELEQLRP